MNTPSRPPAGRLTLSTTAKAKRDQSENSSRAPNARSSGNPGGKPFAAGTGGRSGAARPVEPKVRSNVYHAPESRGSSGNARSDAPRFEPRSEQRAVPAVRPAASALEGTRLNKRMADLGLCSRREADDWIAKGWVLVNEVVAEMGQRVKPQDAIRVDRKATEHKQQQATFLLHKPVGYVSAQAEDGHIPAATLLTAANRWREDASPVRFQPSQLRGVAPAGRLDIDSTGLLVLTQDGLVARQIIGENSELDKEYLVRVEYGSPAGVIAQNVADVFPAESLALLRHGLKLDGKPLLPAQVEWQNPEQLRFVLREGKKRQIRRMCEQVGLYVVGLKRIRIGRIVLGNLPKGQWRYLAEDEMF